MLSDAVDRRSDLGIDQARGMWKVGLEEQVVDSDPVEVEVGQLLIPTVRVDLPMEVEARWLAELGMLRGDVVAERVTVEGLEYERDPADTAFDAHELQRRVPSKDPRHQQIGDVHPVQHEPGGRTGNHRRVLADNATHVD